MKKLLLSTAAIAVMGLSAGTANADAITADALATVAGPVTVSQTTALDFGSFAINGAGTVGTPSSGTPGYSVNTPAIPGPGFALAAVFTVGGEAGETYTVALTGPFTVTDGTDTMTYIPEAPVGSQAVNDGGFDVEAVLTIAGTEGQGAYTGTYAVTVTYE